LVWVEEEDDEEDTGGREGKSLLVPKISFVLKVEEGPTVSKPKSSLLNAASLLLLLIVWDEEEEEEVVDADTPTVGFVKAVFVG
jgi:hypothetical protein